MAKQEPALELISAKDVKVRPVKWLWPFFIPKGKITLLQGDPGDGKSTFMLTLAAYMTRGEPLPFTEYQEPPEPIKVIYQSTEDDYDDTIIPRFIQAGGNLDNLVYINEEANAIIKSLLNDLGVYNGVCTAYLYKYLEPGNTDDLAFYPVVTEMEDFLYYNPNITDPTRCINSNLREHINQQLILLSDSANSGTANLVISSVGSQLSASDTMRQDWVQKQQQAEESGEVVSESGETTEETTEAEVDTEAID